MVSILFAILSATAAELGGYLALSKRKNLNLILGFTAGALIGLVAFDILPEIFEIVQDQNLDITWPMIALVAGFLLLHTIEKSILMHNSHEKQYVIHQHQHVGLASAGALVGHSFLDGVSIGLAFQVNSSVGIAVGIAVIGHRFVDGFNSVNLMLFHKNTKQQAKRVLAVVAVAPIIGAASTLLFTFSQTVLVIYLGFFAGFLLYIAASDILPQAHSKGASRATIGLTVLGAVFMFALTRFI